MSDKTFIRQTHCSDGTTVLEILCPWCGKTSKLKLSTTTWLDGLTAYKNGVLVQHAWPTLSPDERELLVSGICNECWTSMCMA